MIAVTEIITTLACLYFLGYVFNWKRQERHCGLVDAGTTLAQGLLLNYLILLVCRSVPLSLVVSAALALAGALLFARDQKRGALPKPRAHGSAIAGLAVVSVLCAVAILHNPTSTEWDPSSIWFFHAKIIYLARSIGSAADWAHPSLHWLHPDYPKLVSSLSAELCYRLGTWNLYFPKASLLIAIAPALLWLFSFYEKNLSFLILLLLSLLGMGAWLWNGYMDGLLGLYASLVLLLLSRYRAERRGEDLHASICALGVAINLKNEGALYAAVAIGMFILFDLRSMEKKTALRAAITAAAAIAPAIVWRWFVHRHGLGNGDFDYGTSSPITQLASRLSDGKSAGFILESLFVVNHRVRDSALVLLAAACGLRFLRIQVPRVTVRSLMANLVCAIGYSGTLFVVYMITTQDQHELVMLSIDRTTYLVFAILNVSIYLLAREIPVKRTARPRSTIGAPAIGADVGSRP